MTRLAATRKIAWGTLRRAIRALGYASVGGLLGGVIVMVVVLESRPDLKVWHEVELDEEYTAESSLESFPEYLALEQRLFAQLDEKVYREIEPEDRRQINRYHRGSLSDPSRWATNWNRSFELSGARPRAGVVLLHGMSDSPYSMRSLGQILHAEGAWVLGLRMPGHGTAPSGLLEVTWEDMHAAVQLAVAHVAEQVGDRPLFLVGYSNGGALALLYALSALEDPSLPAPSGLVLISPQIGITPLAALASWQKRLGGLLGFEKLSWNSLQPEFDPFKYQSFALNAGVQAHRVTQEIQSRIHRLGSAGALARLAPILAFQSAVDATVSSPALVSGLFEHLPSGAHELVVFDVNRFVELGPVLRADPGGAMTAALGSADRAFALTLVTNESKESLDVLARHRSPGEEQDRVSDLAVSWPSDLFSLSHVALPFPPDDPLYGSDPLGISPIHLGNLALYGERGLLVIPDSELLRLRWNPFHAFMATRTLAFMSLTPAPHDVR